MPPVATARVRITDGEPNPAEPPWISPYINAARAVIASTCPAQSNGAGRISDGDTYLSRTSIPAHTGRLIANTNRQSTVVSKPPSSGPTAPATAPPTAQIPSAFARRRASGNPSRISAIVAGNMMAAPAPWTNRAAMRAPVVGAAAQATDASRNTAIPHPSARFAPMRSDRFPANSSNEANIRV